MQAREVHAHKMQAHEMHDAGEILVLSLSFPRPRRNDVAVFLPEIFDGVSPTAKPSTAQKYLKPAKLYPLLIL
jgi:hypothetical protein